MGFRPFWSPRFGRPASSRGAVAARRSPVEPLERRTLLSVTLTAVADADVQELVGDPNTLNANFGADPLLRVNRINDDEGFETFITFDISAIENVVDAKLKLTGGQVSTPDGEVHISASGVADAEAPFVEGNGTQDVPLIVNDSSRGEIRFAKRPPTDGDATDNRESTIVTSQGEYYWNVTEYLDDAKADGKDVVTFALRQTNGDANATNLVTFGSKDGPAELAPKLIIEENGGGPRAEISVRDIFAPATTHEVQVRYPTENAAIDQGMFDAGDIVVRAPGGPPLTVRPGPTPRVFDADKIDVFYTVEGPGGSWDLADNKDAYTVLLVEGAVEDVNGNPATAMTDVFTIKIEDDDVDPPPGDDTQAPVATFTTLPPAIRTAGGPGATVVATFTDNVGVVASGLTADDLVVTGPGPTGEPLAVEGLALAPAGGGGTSAVATFTVAAPGGSWDAAENGTYQLRLAAGAVADAAGNASAELTNSFEVAIGTGEPPPDPVPGDTKGPVATVTQPQPIIEAGAVDQEVRVTYDDEDSVVSLTSIDVADIVISGGAAGSPPLTVTNVSVSPPAGAKVVTAFYTVAAPGGTWDAADNGKYAITVPAGAAADTSGNASTPAVTVNLEVNIPAPEPAVDPGFGGGGAVSTGFVAEAAAGQPDGKLVVVGRQGDLTAGTSQLVVQRLNPDGTPDTTFGTGGKVLGAQGANEAAFAVAVDEDGTIAVAGTRDGDMMVARYKSTGALDTKFGTGGIAVAIFEGEDTAYSIAIASDGSIVIAGGSFQPVTPGAPPSHAFAFARFLKDGRLDPFFGGGGLLRFDQGGGNVAAAVAIDESGRVVAAGPGEGGKVAVVRLDASGMEDASFDNDGVLVVDQLVTFGDLARPDRSIGVVAQPGGAVLVSNRSPDGDFGIARVATDGKPDPSFGGDGVTTVDFGGEDDADQLLLQGSGEIFALGTTTAGGNQLAVAALAPDGSLITSFGEGGKFTVEATPTAESRELRIGDLVLRAFGSLTQGGRLVLGGSDQRPAAVTNTPLRRLNTPGAASLGTFGLTPGVRKAKKLSFPDADGTVVTLAIKGSGTGEAFSDNGAIDIVLSGVSNSALSVTAKGGTDGRVTIRNVRADGPLKSVTGKTMDVAGTFSVGGGGIGKASLGTLSGTLAAAGPIGTLAFGGDVRGRVLSGANYGVNGQPGGTGGAADGFGQGRIGKLTVAGQMVGATIAAGVDPVDNQLLDADDKLVGGAASAIGPVTVKQGADPSTRFVAGAFAPKVKLPLVVNPLDDPRFMLLQ